MNRTLRSGNEAGFTLVELLVALAITVVIASFIIGGVDLARRAWTISRDRDGAAELDAAATQLRTLLAQAVPANTIDDATRMAQLMFEGRSDALSFVTLSEATALPGGYVRVQLSLDDAPAAQGAGTLLAREGVFRANPALISVPAPVVLVRGVTGFSLRYFGADQIGQAPHWRADWLGRDRLPLAVLVQIDAIDRNETRRITLAVPLRLATNE